MFVNNNNFHDTVVHDCVLLYMYTSYSANAFYSEVIHLSHLID